MSEFIAYLVDRDGNRLGTASFPLKVSGGTPATHTHSYLPYVVATDTPANKIVYSNTYGTALEVTPFEIDNGRLNMNGARIINVVLDGGDLEVL
jgi:hypothetical protein